jgi:hypothetical protein
MTKLKTIKTSIKGLKKIRKKKRIRTKIKILKKITYLYLLGDKREKKKKSHQKQTIVATIYTCRIKEKRM